MAITIHHVDMHVLNMRTRMPFKYGIAALKALPHLFVRVQAEIGGRVTSGIAADGLPPKWFTKNPETDFKHDLDEMFAVIRQAARFAQQAEGMPTVFEWWKEVYTLQSEWAENTAYPPLLWGFGVSLVERAVMDAYSRATGVAFPESVRNNHFGLQLDFFHPELAGREPAEFLPERPLDTVIARHTVGLADPLDSQELPEDEAVEDGLPQALDVCVKTYSLTHFKIKLAGHPARDVERLLDIAEVLERLGIREFAFTLDGNEQFRNVDSFKETWYLLCAEAGLREFMQHALFVEQPLRRDMALSDKAARDLKAWKDRPPILIDESDGEIESLPLAIDSGYAGSSYKSCKGVFKGIANACLIEHRRRRNPGGEYILSGEDLAIVGPVSLTQDLAAMAALGIGHVERNGHHYFAGLSMYPPEIQVRVLAAHPDLYTRHLRGFPTLRIEKGRLRLDSVLRAPFGYGFDFDPGIFTPLPEWSYASLSRGEP
ncbi:MAG: hypothetical protein ACE15F_17195 [bacterium]